MEKTKILLADLAYIHPNEYLHPLPLGIGYIGAYLKQELDDIQIELFKDPNELYEELEKIKNYNIIALSNYAWNMRLDFKFLKLIREKHPGIVTLMGGPNIDTDSEDRLKEFFLSVPELDFYILGEGERNFYELVKLMLENGMKPNWDKLPAAILGFDRRKKMLLRGKATNAGTCDLKCLPSPYLNGMMDKFLEDPRLSPMMETSRGCPFHCAFCCWGSAINSKVRQFPIENVLREMEYIEQRTKNPMKLLYFTDANFGIFERDELIARAVKELSQKTGFPKGIFFYFLKNTNETVLRMGHLLKGLTSVSMSKQTLNQDVLKIIGRDNISHDKFKLLQDQLHGVGVDSGCELIYGLPGETLDSFLKGVELIASSGVAPCLYPLLLLKGTKLNSEEFRKKYKIESSFRLMFRYSGTFGSINSAEYEEVATSNSKFSKEDFLKVRLVHFLQFIFSEKIFEEMIKYIAEKKENMISFILFLLHERSHWPEFMESMVRGFEKDARDELIEKEDLKFEFSEKEIADIKSRPLALNLYYLCRLITEKASVASFKRYLLDNLEKFFNINNVQYSMGEILVIINVCFDKLPDFPDTELVRVKEYHYNLDSWLQSAGKSFCDYRVESALKYEFRFERNMFLLFKEQYLKHGDTGIALYWFRMNFLANPHLAYTYLRSMTTRYRGS